MKHGKGEVPRTDTVFFAATALLHERVGSGRKLIPRFQKTSQNVSAATLYIRTKVTKLKKVCWLMDIAKDVA